MPCRGAEFTARALQRVGITVALGARHGKRMGGDEFVERGAMAVRGNVAAFRHGDLQEVASNAGQADGLRRSGTFVRGRHFLQIEVIHDKEKRGTDQNANKRAHSRIVALPVARCNRTAQRGVQETTSPFSHCISAARRESCQSPSSASARNAPPSDGRRNTTAPPLELRKTESRTSW